MKFQPRLHQKKAIKHLIEKSHAALFLDPGLGKTSASLAAFKLLKQRKFVRRALVIAPLRVCHLVWPVEIQKWDDFHGITCQVLHGRTRVLPRDLDDLPDVCVINPEGLAWLFTTLQDLGQTWPFDWLIMDESTLFKNTRSQRFKLLKNHIARFERRTALTGTPTPNGLLDMFGQAYLVDGGRALGKYITHYRAEFFESYGYMGYEFRLIPGADKKILSRVAQFALSMSAEDWLALPTRVDNVIEVELPPEAARLYREVEDKFIAAIGNNDFIVAETSAAAAMKCRQIANGGVYTEQTSQGDRVWSQVHEAKVDALEELVESLNGSPLLVAYEFHHDVERILKRFPKTPVIRGGVSTDDMVKIVSDWNAGKIPLLLAQPQSMAHGLNLQSAGNTVAWFGLIWNFEVYDQFIRRVWRQGQKFDRVIIHHIVAKGTVDEDVMRSLRGKERAQRSVIQALKARRANR